MSFFSFFDYKKLFYLSNLVEILFIVEIFKVFPHRNARERKKFSQFDAKFMFFLSRAFINNLFVCHQRIHPIQSYRETAKTISSSLHSLTFLIFHYIKLMSRWAPSTPRHCHRCRFPSLLARLQRVAQELTPHRGGLTASGDECRHEVARPCEV
jgi:hypothetical protein